MAMDEGPKLGRKIEDGERCRDAIHVAVAPVTAQVQLKPGEHVGLVDSDNSELVGPCDSNIGIVDPFLNSDIEPGDRFWLFLYPNSVTGMRHVWKHPAFQAKPLRDKVKSVG